MTSNVNALPATDDGVKKLEGIYTFEFANGSFDVHLRSDYRFFSPKFQARASWEVETKDVDGTTKVCLTIDWGKFGIYDMTLEDPATKYFYGHKRGMPENWRKMTMRRKFSTAESSVMDSVWELSHPSGNPFEVEFRADGFNHFVCKDFSAHSHWTLNNAEDAAPEMYINWGKYGEYVLTVAADGLSMAGSAKGKPDNWRKLKRLRDVGKGVEEAHVHDH